MEEPQPQPRKQETKKKKMAIKIGAGAGDGAGAGAGIRGIVLFGGALVIATLVSAFAIKTRRRRKKTPPRATTTDDDPPPANNLELMMKNSKDSDVSKGFSLVNFPDSSPSSDATAKMGVIQIEPNQNLILDEKPKLEINGDDEEIHVFSTIHKEAQSNPLFDDSAKLMKESSEEIEAMKENEEIYKANQLELEIQSNLELREEECHDDGGEVIEEKCEEVGIQLSEEIPEMISGFESDGVNKEEFSLPVLDYKNECNTELPILIRNEAHESTQEDDEAIETGCEDQVTVEEKEEILFGNERDLSVETSVEKAHEGDVAEEDKEGIGQFSDDQETIANNNEEAVCSDESISPPLLTESIELVKEEAIEEEAAASDVDDKIKVEDNLPDLQILEEEEREENQEDGHGEIIPENHEQDQLVREEEQQMQEEEYDKSLSIALIRVMEEEEAIEATCVDPIPIKVEDSPEMQMMDAEEEGEDDIDDDQGEVIAENPEESSAYAEQVAVEVDKETTINGGHENFCSGKSASVEKFSLPLLESELLSEPEMAKENESTTSLLSSEAINVINEDDRIEVAVEEDNIQNQLVENEEKDQTPEMQSSDDDDEEEAEAGSDEDITKKAEESSETGDSSMESHVDAIWPAQSMSQEISSAKIKHIKEDKTMENDDIVNEEKGNNEIATTFGQRYTLIDQWKLKTWTLSMMVPLWCCLCHWYFGMPLIKLCLVGIMFLIVLLLGFPKPMLLTRK